MSNYCVPGKPTGARRRLYYTGRLFRVLVICVGALPSDSRMTRNLAEVRQECSPRAEGKGPVKCVNCQSSPCTWSHDCPYFPTPAPSPAPWPQSQPMLPPLSPSLGRLPHGLSCSQSLSTPHPHSILPWSDIALLGHWALCT